MACEYCDVLTRPCAGAALLAAANVSIPEPSIGVTLFVPTDAVSGSSARKPCILTGLVKRDELRASPAVSCVWEPHGPARSKGCFMLGLGQRIFAASVACKSCNFFVGVPAAGPL